MQIAILSFFHYFTVMFKKRENVFEVEEGKFLSPKFDGNGLIPVTTTDSSSGELLMHGYMNAEALKKTIETKEAHYWSRSKKALWHKGKTSGFVQKVIDLRIDDDQTEAILMIGEIGGNAEEEAAHFFKNHKVKKPIAGFIAGKTAPPGRTMGHAGAIVSGGSGGADAKVKVMSECGFIMSESPSGLGEAVVKAIQEWK